MTCFNCDSWWLNEAKESNSVARCFSNTEVWGKAKYTDQPFVYLSNCAMPSEDEAETGLWILFVLTEEHECTGLILNRNSVIDSTNRGFRPYPQ